MELTTDTYAIPQDLLDFRATIRQIADERIAPRAAEIDATGEFPDDVRQLFAEHDLFGLPFAERHGGTGTGALMLCVAIEEIAKACASSALILAAQDLGTLPIRLAGASELQDRVLPRCGSVVVAVGVWPAEDRAVACAAQAVEQGGDDDERDENGCGHLHGPVVVVGGPLLRPVTI